MKWNSLIINKKFVKEGVIMKPFIVAIDVGAPRNIGWYCSTFEKEPGDNACGTIDDLPGLLEKKII